jgi:hypothetical protein
MLTQRRIDVDQDRHTLLEFHRASNYESESSCEKLLVNKSRLTDRGPGVQEPGA